MEVLGFILRVSHDFKLLMLLKFLYGPLIRPILDYSSILWDSSSTTAGAMEELVQRIFLNITTFRLNITHSPHDYSPVLQAPNLSRLADRHHSSNLSFLCNFLFAKLDSPSILPFMNFKVLFRSTRSFASLNIPRSTTHFFDNSPMVRLIRTANHDPSYSL